MKKKFWLRLTSIPALALSLVIWSCADAGDPARDLLGPQGLAYEGAESTDGAAHRLLKGNDGHEMSVSALIGSEGGKLELGRHELKVPQGAVGQPTVFTMQLQDESYVRVKLTAVATDAEGQVVFTGADGFAVPVKLELSYVDASESFSVSDLRIVWVREGSLEVQATTVNTDLQEVEAFLGHFSDYAVAVPN